MAPERRPDEVPLRPGDPPQWEARPAGHDKWALNDISPSEQALGVTEFGPSAPATHVLIRGNRFSNLPNDGVQTDASNVRIEELRLQTGAGPMVLRFEQRMTVLGPLDPQDDSEVDAQRNERLHAARHPHMHMPQLSSMNVSPKYSASWRWRQRVDSA